MKSHDTWEDDVHGVLASPGSEKTEHKLHSGYEYGWEKSSIYGSDKVNLQKSAVSKSGKTKLTSQLS